MPPTDTNTTKLRPVMDRPTRKVRSTSFHSDLAFLSFCVPFLPASSAFALTSIPVQRHFLSTVPKPSPFRSRLLLRTSASDVSSTDVSTAFTLNHVNGIRSVIGLYSVFLLDMWGVMHDGSKPYRGVIDAVKRLKKAGKKIVILSNSSKRRSDSIQGLTNLGFDPDDFAQIITSGEVSHRMLSGDDTLECSRWQVVSNLIESKTKNAFVFGSGNGDEQYCSSSGWILSPIDRADLIIARGTFTINDGSGNVIFKTKDEFIYDQVLMESLQVAARRKVPMLICNPDKIRPDESLSPMPGAIGDLYETILGDDTNTSLVKRIGKPYPEVYELALRGIDPSVAIMVGDALETDILGGTHAKCATLWVVNGGIHGPSIARNEMFIDNVWDELEKFNKGRGSQKENEVLPTFVVPHLRW